MASTTTTLNAALALPLEDLPSYENGSNRELGPPSNNGDTEARQVQATVYSRFSNLQKRSITAFLALCSFMTSMSTTCIFPAIPELLQTFSTTAFVIGISNAVYLAVMGAAALIWGPSADVFGRRAFRSTDKGTQVYRFSLLMFCAASIGTAFSPTLVAFFVFRGLSAIPSTSFLILGSSCISDIYHPTERGASMGWLLSGSMIGPAFGPLLALAGVACILALFYFPETIHYIRATEISGHKRSEAVVKLLRWLNPYGMVKLYGNKNFLMVRLTNYQVLASSAVGWNMFALLTPLRLILNPRLNLTTPLQSGLLYISPGAGYLVGGFIGGHWADYTVRVWTEKRGYRLPEDRLRGCLPFLGIVLPLSMALYGWMVDRRIGGIPVPVICMFFQGIGQTSAFPSLNGYILDILQDHIGEASGWSSTISSFIFLAVTALVYLTVRLGSGWREEKSRG
uniref:Major facilitator superfamily (MFS) profile domain-containing protein n=1 Tax=Bionectria ochroleuca TaxID=29856 RepID=A0A0B7KAZ4_BIOOC